MKNERMQISLDKKIHQAFKKYANTNGMKLIALLDKIVEQYLKKEK